MRLPPPLSVWLLTICLALLPVTVRAQRAIAGHVRDAAGRGLPAVVDAVGVSAWSTGEGGEGGGDVTTTTVTADVHGRYRLDLPAGDYTPRFAARSRHGRDEGQGRRWGSSGAECASLARHAERGCDPVGRASVCCLTHSGRTTGRRVSRYDVLAGGPVRLDHVGRASGHDARLAASGRRAVVLDTRGGRVRRVRAGVAEPLGRGAGLAAVLGVVSAGSTP